MLELNLRMVLYSGLCAIVALMCTETVIAYNLDTDSPIVYEDPIGREKRPHRTSYFGYTVILHPGDIPQPTPWIQVGAPRGNWSTHPTIVEPGVVFRCGIPGRCKKFVLDKTGNERRNGKTRNQNYYEHKDGAWIGGSMDVDVPTNRVAVCGHRWVNYRQTRKDDHYYTEGICYVSIGNDTTKFIPLVDNKKAVRTVFYYGMGQAGFSVHFPQNVKKSQLLLGAPGINNWEGSFVRYEDADDGLNHVNRRAVLNMFGIDNIPDPEIYEHTWSYFLQGYQVTSGRFFDNSLVYVAGGPRGHSCIQDCKYAVGMVVLFDFAKESEKSIIEKFRRYGTQMGEYFGASLTVGDINGDGLDDLIVGSPMYSVEWEEGRVSVFLGNRLGKLTEPFFNSIITGKTPSGRFGSTIASAGDLDRDGFDDIIISAPYENDHSGVVYVYNGCSNGLSLKYSQRIKGTDIDASIRGFGISFSRGTDVDGNYYKDIAVGSYISGHAVVFRAYPVVQLHSVLRSKTAIVDRDTKFTVQACLWYTSEEGPSTIDVTRELHVDEELSRAHVAGHKTLPAIYYKNVTLSLNEHSCEPIEITIMEEVLDRVQPIEITLHQRLIERKQNKSVIWVRDKLSGEDNFCKTCPVLHRNSSTVKPYRLELPFALECAKTTVCLSDLKLKADISLVDGSFLVGSNELVQLNVSIKNEKEPAYLVEVEIIIPEVINFDTVPNKCELDGPRMRCLVANPLYNFNKVHIVSVNLDMEKLGDPLMNGIYQDLSINVTVFTKSEELTPDDNTELITIDLISAADLAMFGKSHHAEYSYISNKENVTLVQNINFTHLYEVQKLGVSPIAATNLTVRIPTLWKTANEDLQLLKSHKLESFLSGQPFTCSDPKLDVAKKANYFWPETIPTATDETLPLANRTLFINCSSPYVYCSEIVCQIGQFKQSGSTASLRVWMELNIELIQEKLLGLKDIIYMSTEAYVNITSPADFEQNGDRLDYKRVSSLFHAGFKTLPIPLWIIILSATIGLLVLLLVITGMAKAGFFERKKKDQLLAMQSAQE